LERLSGLVGTNLRTHWQKWSGISINSTNPAKNAALDYLISTQDTSGSWQSDPLQTALVLKAFSSTALTDADGDGIPNAVETILGTNPSLADGRTLIKGNGLSVPGVSTSPLLGTAKAGQAFNYQLNVTGGTGQHTWKIVAGSLPTGLTLNSSNGQITGIPIKVGQFNFIYKVTDATGASLAVAAQIDTGAPDPNTSVAPNVTTGAATLISGHTATLNGTVNPYGLSTTYYFQWGRTTAYDNTTSNLSAGSNWVDNPVTANLTGLILNATYHYRLVATNSKGTTYGSDLSFLAHKTDIDFNNDNTTDITAWRPGDGNWYVIDSSTGTTYSKQWGMTGDIPVPGDYDGDSKTDFAVWRPSEGKWYVSNSMDNTTVVQQWGSATLHDVPVPGDYDGDGKTDFAVWRPGDGNWYIKKSSSGTTTVQQWGQGTLGDIPVPGDYDGDGKTDFAVWRSGDGKWYILNSSDGTVRVQQWGGIGLNDIPISSDTII
jgi:hypothetical protein